MDMQIPAWDDGRRHPHTLKVHIENNELTEMLDKWFSDNHISDLKVVSKAWNKMSRLYQRIVGDQIAKHLVLPPGYKAKWSRKCGCSCGCSPGWNAQVPPDHQYGGHTTWATLEVKPEDKAALQRCIDRIGPLLKLDQEEHNKEVAAKPAV